MKILISASLTLLTCFLLLHAPTHQGRRGACVPSSGSVVELAVTTGGSVVILCDSNLYIARRGRIDLFKTSNISDICVIRGRSIAAVHNDTLSVLRSDRSLEPIFRLPYRNMRVVCDRFNLLYLYGGDGVQPNKRLSTIFSMSYEGTLTPRVALQHPIDDVAELSGRLLMSSNDTLFFSDSNNNVLNIVDIYNNIYDINACKDYFVISYKGGVVRMDTLANTHLLSSQQMRSVACKADTVYAVPNKDTLHVEVLVDSLP
jgi:hypothetical protein